MAKLMVPDFHPGKLQIDGVDIVIHVRRHDMDEALAYEREYFKYASPDKGVQDPVEGEDAMSTEEILLARQKAAEVREQRMTQAERDSERARLIQKAEEFTAWIKQVITENVTIPEGEIEWRGAPVIDGAGLLKVYGSRTLLMMQVLNLIWALNHLPEKVKNELPSLSDFPVSSDKPLMAAAGVKPVRIAGNVEREGYAPVEGATAVPQPGETLSGVTT